MNMTRICTKAIGVTVAVAGLVAASHAQTITTRVLADWDSAYRPAGDRPSLRDGVVAFLGRENAPAPERWAVFRGTLNDSEPFTPIAWAQMQTGDLIPWRTDGSWWVGFDNPIVFGGTVHFDGTRTPNGTGTFSEGFVRHTPTTFERAFGALGMVSIGQRGILDGRFFYDTAFNNTIILQGGATLPGGGTVPSTSSFIFQNVLEGYAQEGTTCALTPRINLPTGTKGGVYTWESGVGPLRVVANFDDEIPGLPGRTFDGFSGVDTDGTQVSFSGYDGVLGQGGVSGVVVGPAAGRGSGSLRSIATTGQLSPFGSQYLSFGYTAIQGDAVFFDASIGPDFTQARYAAFVAIGNTVVPIYRSGDVLHGRRMLDGRINHRALDGNDFVMWARYEDATAPGGAGVMLLHVHINRPCRADFNADTVVDFFDYLDFVSVFANGGTSADFNADTVVEFFDYLDFVAAFSAGC